MTLVNNTINAYADAQHLDNGDERVVILYVHADGDVHCCHHRQNHDYADDVHHADANVHGNLLDGYVRAHASRSNVTIHQHP